jgi:hypothetical protein
VDPAFVLASTATVFAWFTPWLVHRRGDVVPWRSLFQTENARFWWAAVSIASFASVFTVGRAFGLVEGGVLAFAIDVGFVVTFHRRFARTRNLERLCAGLSDVGGAPSALVAVDAELSRLRDEFDAGTHGHEAWAQWTLRAAARAGAAGHTAEALRWIDRIDVRRVRRDTRDVHAQYTAAFRIRLGDRDGARALLARMPRPAERPDVEEYLCALDALITALDGDPRAALSGADRALTERLNPTSRAVWQATRAHALEATGSSHEARTVLRALQAEHGDAVIKSVAAHDGPASPAATALLAEQGPYR